MRQFSFSLFATAMCAWATVCHAEQMLDVQGQYLFGDLQGKRTELAQKGIKFEANALTDTNYLADGGHNAGASPSTASQFWLGTQFDLEKLAGWEGVTIRFVATARQGQSTSIRDLQDPSAPQLANVQATYGRGNQDSRLSELSIEKRFKEQGLSIKVGQLGLGSDFDVMACDFVSNAFCAAQMGKWQGNIWMNTPVSQWGGRIKYQVTPEVATQVGVYEFNPDNGNGKAEGQGWSLDTEHADGVTIPVEVIWTPKALLNGLAGSYRVGGIYNTADDPNNQYDVAYGKGVVGEDRTFAGWIAIEQQLTSTGAGRQGLHSFANFTWHDRITNKVDNSQQVGLKYIGVFEQHPTDILGLGVNRVHLNDRFTAGKAQYDASAEYNIELNYSYNPTPWLMLRPNIQYVVNSGSSHVVDNALVLGLGSRIIF